jgi:hypothetical protein
MVIMGFQVSFENSMGSYPPYYQHPSHMSHDYYPPMLAQPYYHSSIDYQEAYNLSTHVLVTSHNN